MIIEKVKEFVGVYDAYLLLNQYGIFNFLQVGSSYVAIVTRNNTKITNCGTITVREVKDKPLWKQHMELSMGRVPRPDVRQYNYRVRELSELEIQQNRFEVYREV